MVVQNEFFAVDDWVQTAVTPGALQLGCGGHCCSLSDPMLNISNHFDPKKFQSCPKIHSKSGKTVDQLGLIRITRAPGNLPKDQRPVVHRHAHCICHKVLWLKTGKIYRKLGRKNLVYFLDRTSGASSKLQQHNIMVL